MQNADSPANAVLQSLGFALFVREPSGALRAAAGPPPWLKALWPTVGVGEEPLDSGISPFLENFLIDAEECWRKGGETRVRSGPWVEQDAQGAEVQLEATALTISGQAILLLEKLGEAFEVKKSVLQKARENVIAYQRLNSEIQKKEILLHCVAEDMTAALANIVTSLRLLELETSSPRSRLLLGLASRATDEQQALIHKVLAIFAEELSGLFGQDGTGETAANLHAAALAAIENTAAQVAEKKSRIVAPAPTANGTPVALAAHHLQSLVTNLIENALEHLPTGGEVVIRLTDEGETVVLHVEDDGPTVPAEVCDDLFSKFEPIPTLTHAPILKLHFCRMLAEGCGGEIGCGTRDGGGNRFWIRLPKATA